MILRDTSPGPRRRGRYATASRRPGWAWVARGAGVAVVALATLTSLEPDFDVARALRGIGPALTTGLSARDVVDAVRNFVLFGGWGVIWVATSHSRWQRSLRWAAITGFALSAAVETAQLFSPVRQTSIVDVLTNTTGALAGAGMLLAMIQVAARSRGGRSYVGVPALGPAVAYLVAVAAEAVIPLTRGDPVPGVTGGPVARFRQAWSDITLGSDLVISDVLLFLPAGILTVVALVEIGWSHRRAGFVVGGGGAVASVAAELSRGALGMTVEVGPMILHAVAIGAGAWIAAAGLPPFSRKLRGAARTLAVVVGYAIVLLLWSWRPYLPKTSLTTVLAEFTSGRLVPLGAHAWRVDFFSVADVVIPFFLYLPLGALLAVWPLKRTGLLAGAWPAVVLAAGLEAGQILVATRFFDGTDLIVGAAGALIGWLVVRRAGYRPYGTLLPIP